MTVPVPDSDDEGATRRWDIRLVPAAALGWLVAWAAPLLSAGALITLAGTALVLAAGCLMCARPTRAGRRRWAAAAALLLSGLALVAGTSAAKIYARDESPLRVLSTQEQDVLLRFRVSEAIRGLGSGSTRSRVLVAAEAVAATCDHPCGGRSIRSWQLSGDLLIFAPAQGWAELTPGSVVTAEVTLAPAFRQDMLVAIAFARGRPEATMTPTGVLNSATAGVRDGLEVRADRVLHPDEAGLLRGIVLGDTAGMDAILLEQFRISGLAHVTAVSGTNCAIVIGAVLWTLRGSRLRGRTRACVAGLALAGFVVLVGPQPSVLRAAVMGAITLLALASGSTRQAVPALAGAVLVLLAVDPSLARDLGFALSVAATTGIVVVGSGWALRLRTRGWPEPVASVAAVCAAAGLFTAPLLVLIVARVSLISLPANLLIAPVVAFVTVLGLAAALLSPICPWLSEVLLRLVDVPLRWMVWIAEHAARTPGAVVPWPSGLLGALALVGALVLLVTVLRRPGLRLLVAATCAGIVVSGVSIRVLAPGWPPSGWLFAACDVGQGDALVIALGSGRALVVDAGPDPVLVDECLRRLGVQDVPLLVLSHLHADHIDGLAGILHGRNVAAVATAPAPPPMDASSRIHTIAAEAGVPVISLTPGETRVLGPAIMAVLGPVARYVGTRSDPNNSSLVLRITVDQVSILATGDVESEAQHDLLRRGIDVTADILKVPHHGSAYQDPAFLTATQAQVALISVGADNDYGHPNEVLVDRLVAAGMSVHRTDQDGDIAVLRAAESLTVLGRGDPTRRRVNALSDNPVPGLHGAGGRRFSRLIRRSGLVPARSPRRGHCRDHGVGLRSRPPPAPQRRAGRPARPRD